MGSTYVNLTVRGADQGEVLAFVADRAAYVSAEYSGSVVVLDQLSEWALGEYELITLATAMSMKFSTAVLSVAVHDSDVFAYWLHRNGKLLDWYNSFSGEASPGVTLDGPSGGSPEALIAAFGCGDVSRLGEILRSKHDGEYVIEDHRHKHLVSELGLPTIAVGLGYQYFCTGRVHEGLPPFRATGSAGC